MKAEHHIVISTAVSGSLYALCPSWQLALAALVAGVLIDLDHCVDYIIEFGVWSNWRNFFRSFHEGQYAQIYIFLHSWELLLVLGAASWLTGCNPWVVGVLIGATQHMILDQLSNGTAGAGYFLLWRWSKGFSPNITFPHHAKPFKSLKKDG